MALTIIKKYNHQYMALTIIKKYNHKYYCGCHTCWATGQMVCSRKELHTQWTTATELCRLLVRARMGSFGEYHHGNASQNLFTAAPNLIKVVQNLVRRPQLQTKSFLLH